jgi:hypothetical protein
VARLARWWLRGCGEEAAARVRGVTFGSLILFRAGGAVLALVAVQGISVRCCSAAAGAVLLLLLLRRCESSSKLT